MIPSQQHRLFCLSSPSFHLACPITVSVSLDYSFFWSIERLVSRKLTFTLSSEVSSTRLDYAGCIFQTHYQHAQAMSSFPVPRVSACRLQMLQCSKHRFSNQSMLWFPMHLHDLSNTTARQSSLVNCLATTYLCKKKGLY